MKERILIVDDEKDLTELLAAMLEPLGHEIHCAHSAKDALAMTEIRPYPIILLDIRLPDGDGTELIPKFKSFNPFAQIIMMTAYTSMENVVYCLERGALDYFTKPFRDTEAIMATIQNAAERIARWRKAIPMFPR